MIEKILNKMSPMTRRRWRIFFRQKRAIAGLVIFALIFAFSMTAEVWSHSRPLVIQHAVPLDLQKAQELAESGTPEKDQLPLITKYFFPAFIDYSAQDLGVFDSFTIDYRRLLEDDMKAEKKTWAIFPLNPWDPYTQTENILSPPSRVHYLGTDNLGRDVAARMIYGLRVSLAFGLLLWGASYLVGITIGVLQGYFIGRFDFYTERFKELAEIIPFLSIVILVNGVTKEQSFAMTLGIVLLFAWIEISSQMRAVVLSLRNSDFTEAVRALGGSPVRAIFKHILPNSLTPILTLTPFAISVGIATLTTLDYLGFGLAPPTPSIGELLFQGRNYITSAIWLLYIPTSALIVLLISINMIGESLRQAFDPRA